MLLPSGPSEWFDVLNLIQSFCGVSSAEGPLHARAPDQYLVLFVAHAVPERLHSYIVSLRTHVEYS